eukprot:COSAG01_NODE_3069_length_6640_cov_2.893441_7_plen_65_part_00
MALNAEILALPTSVSQDLRGKKSALDLASQAAVARVFAGGNAVNAAQVVVIVWASVDRARIPPR